MQARNLTAFALLGVSVSWLPFRSAAYQYSVSEPSSFGHALISDSSGRKADYFFPPLGSFTTNVNIYAERSTVAPRDGAYLRSLGARRVRRQGTLRIMGRNFPVTVADFHGLAGHWTEEQISFTRRGWVWHLTMSYDQKYRSLRPILLRIIRSFHV